MTDHQGWTYYRLYRRARSQQREIFYRRGHGVTEWRYTPTATWEPADPAELSRAIETGDVGLTETTRENAEAEPWRRFADANEEAWYEED